MKCDNVETRTLKVDGYFEIPKDMKHLEFLDKLTDFLESFGATFGGETRELPEESE